MSEPYPHVSSSRERRDKRSLDQALPDATPSSARKAPKISRSCDICKSKRARCTGTISCDCYMLRNLTCMYEAKYSRGRPPTPTPATHHALLSSPAAEGVSAVQSPAREPDIPPQISIPAQHTERLRTTPIPTTPTTARGPPELEVAVIGGQYFESTSTLTFLHRAYKLLSTQHNGAGLHDCNNEESGEPLISAGYKPFLSHNTSACIPSLGRERTSMILL